MCKKMDKKEAKWYSPWYQGTGLFFWVGLPFIPVAMVCSAPIIAVAVVGVGGFMAVQYVIGKCHADEVIKS